MILSGLIKLIKAAVDGFVNLLVMLLVKAGMWLPAVFSIAFIVICLSFGIPFTGFTTGVFLTGVIVTAIIGGMLAFKHHMKLKRAVPPKNKVRYMNKPSSKTVNKYEDYSGGEWDNGSRSQSGRVVADEDRVGRHNNDFAYKPPEPIYNGYDNGYNGEQPAYERNAEEQRRQENGGYGSGSSPQKTSGSSGFGKYYSGHESFDRDYNQSNGNQHNPNNPQYNGSQYNPNPPQYNGSQYNPNPQYNQNNPQYNNPPHNPNPSHFGGSSHNPNQGGGVSYEDFNELKRKLFGADGNSPQNETAATYQNPQNGYDRPSDYGFSQNNGFSQGGTQNGGFQSGFNQGGGFNQSGYSEQKSPFDRFFDRVGNESPQVFKTRRDPNIVIHEYSDRLEFYRKTATGLVLISVERKG